MKKIPVLIAGGGPVGMTLARTLASFGIRCLLVERNASTTRHPKMDITNGRSMELFRRLGRGRPTARCRRARGEQLRRLLDHVADRPRAAPLPLSQRRRKARRDSRQERRHPAARAGHARQPGHDRAGAAGRHPEPSAGRCALGRGLRGFPAGRRRRDGDACAPSRPARPNRCAATSSPAATAARASCATSSASAWRAALRWPIAT